jgi:hypothetical protein
VLDDLHDAKSIAERALRALFALVSRTRVALGNYRGARLPHKSTKINIFVRDLDAARETVINVSGGCTR